VKPRWTEGNSVRLLENGEDFFPAVFDAIRGAEHEVIVETFILFEDKVGLELHAALIDAANRGVRVDLMVDGFGSADLSARFVDELCASGARLRTFDPGWRLFGQRLNVLRRMHRKLVVVDARLAFVGGINFSADHLGDFGPMAKQDYTVALRGPVVDDIRRFALAAIGAAELDKPLPPPSWRDGPLQAEGQVRALFVTRDNQRHHNAIERYYRLAIRRARHHVLIANAYFFPGYRVLRQLTRAARRGVRVQLVLQGEPDMPIVKTAAQMLYGYLQRHGVEVYEYCRRPLHGKVAVVDDEWSTVGSSNLDPLSLSLNLEANVVLHDTVFAAELRQRLQLLIENDCKSIEPQPRPKSDLWLQFRNFVLFHFLRRFPAWARILPEHAPQLVLPEGAALDRSQPARGNVQPQERQTG
jgi:cardiolipin synthase